jgi:DNA-binding response OmpR family regulator
MLGSVAPATTPAPTSFVIPGARSSSGRGAGSATLDQIARGVRATDDEERPVHLLVLTERTGGSAALLPGLEFLDHTVQDSPLEPSSLQALGRADVVLVDATVELRRAAGAARAASLHELAKPVLLVMPEGALAALKLTWGFDDWLLPQASPAELETRLRLVRDRALADAPQRAANVGDLVVDEDSYQVRLRGQPLDLTYKEFELIKALANSPNRVFTRDLLLQEVWGYDYFGGSRTVDVHIRRLRAKLGPEYEQMIVTVRGVGYKLVPPGQRQHRGPEDLDESERASAS